MPPKISGHSAGEIPNAVLLERIAIRFGCQHGLRLTRSVELVSCYNALGDVVVPPHGVRCLTKDLGPSAIIPITSC